VKKQKFTIIGPDNLPLRPKPFASRKQAADYIPEWCARYRQQGYYRDARREIIELADLPNHCRIEEL
jgi:hypothetical protein